MMRASLIVVLLVLDGRPYLARAAALVAARPLDHALAGPAACRAVRELHLLVRVVSLVDPHRWASFRRKISCSIRSTAFARAPRPSSVGTPRPSLSIARFAAAIAIRWCCVTALSA